MTHQPAISFSISFQHPFNRAGGRTSNVRLRMKNLHSPNPFHTFLHPKIIDEAHDSFSELSVSAFYCIAQNIPCVVRHDYGFFGFFKSGDYFIDIHVICGHRPASTHGQDAPSKLRKRTRRRAPTGHKLFNHFSTSFSVAPVGGHGTLARE